MLHLPELPVKGVLPNVADALLHNRSVVLQAPPGTGKTLLTAPYLLNAPWLEGRKIILLEPRRLAARMAASSMARLLGEKPGETVGYQMRLERCIGPKTRIEILTEGLLLQRILHDEELADTGLIIFDEFHERNLFADFALAAALNIRSVIREDLRLIVMSATIDADTIARHLGSDTAVVSATAPLYPIETIHLDKAPGLTPIPDLAVQGIIRALRETEGGILTFLPGEGEIRRTQALLEKLNLPPGTVIRPLYGALPKSEQDLAVTPPPPGQRKIVLSTSIAESSLTIQDIRVVVDCGYSRTSRFSPATGMSRLETIRVTRDRADQRRGRAGRIAPGTCYRMWDTTTDATLMPEALPEILDADLAPTRLQSAYLGAPSREDLPWPTLPPDNSWKTAGNLLESLDALTGDGRITPKGKNLVRLAIHPRLAHMFDKAKEAGATHKAALVAAIVSEAASEPRLRGEDNIERLTERLTGSQIQYGENAMPKDWAQKVRTLADNFARKAPQDTADISVGRLLSWAYPDRIAISRDGGGHYRMTSGRGAQLQEGSTLWGERTIVIAELQDTGADGQIRLAAKADIEEIEEDHQEHIQSEQIVTWTNQQDRLTAVTRRRLGALTLSEAPLKNPSPELCQKAQIEAIRRHGIENLGWTDESRNLQARINFLRQSRPQDDWPDAGDQALEQNVEQFLEGWLDGLNRWDDIKKLDLTQPLLALTGHRQRELDELAPTAYKLPCGHRARIHYDQGDIPVMSAKLQDFFGLTQTPKIAGGTIPVKITLLSPAQRPIAVTTDLATFWQTGYPLVRKEMRGRYPKHDWRETP